MLTSEDGVLASLAVEEARALTKARCLAQGRQCRLGRRRIPALNQRPMADEPVDVWLKPYERSNDTEAAMNAYLSWEVDLLERIKQDGTTHFLHAR